MEKILEFGAKFEGLNQWLVRDFGYTVKQVVAVCTISQHNGPIAIGEFGLKLSKSGAACTSMADLLEKKGLVQRTHSKEDRRSVLLSLTEDGKALVRRLEGIRLPIAG